jgi:hypothetical protein
MQEIDVGCENMEENTVIVKNDEKGAGVQDKIAYMP